MTSFHITRGLRRGLPLWLGLAVPFALASCSAPQRANAVKRFEFTRPQMGVSFRVVLYAPDRATAELAAQAAFNRVAQLNQMLSDYETDSELTELSRTSGQGKAVKVSDDLWRVLARAQAVSEQSNGAFDMTVGPSVSLWRNARREKKLPDPGRLAVARQAVGYEKIRLNRRERTVELLKPNMSLDLGGIAKGYAVDEALKVLRERGVTRALVGADGDIAVGDPPPDRPAWRIAIAPFDATNAPPTQFVLLKRAAISTSGDASQRVEIDGKRYSHIVDPRTGVGLTDHSLVTVIAPDCTTADSLATAVSVLGPEAGLKLIEQTDGAAARIMRKPGETIEEIESRRFANFRDAPAESGGRP